MIDEQVSAVALAPTASTPWWRSAVRRGMVGQQSTLVLVIVVLAIVGGLKNSIFFSHDNLVEILKAATLYFIAACPATLILTMATLDLSVGAIYAAGAVVAGEFMNHGVPWPLAILLGMVFGGVVGSVNGVLIETVNIPPFITTLATFFAIDGLTSAATGGNNLFGFPSGFNAIGGQAIWIAVVIGIIFHLVLTRSQYGYDIRAVGGNRAAAVANGIPARRLSIWMFVISGAVSALAGIVLASQLASASPSVGGPSFTFQIITAVIIGGTSLFGGRGTIIGTALGVLLFSEIDNVLSILNVNPLYSEVAVGAILIAAVGTDQLRRRRQFAMSH
ncbi:MAG TPA: ABC transporter permease [Micromonosporaceae bacterium]